MNQNQAKSIRLEGERHTKFAMRLSLGAGFFMLVIKLYAYWITQSSAILSDATESVVHVVAVSFAAYSLALSMKPPDRSHPYGHDRISFFSAGFEGAMIVFAAVYIIYESIKKWLGGLHLENLEAGTGFIFLATVLNGVLGWYLVRQGKKYHSIVLEANGKHILTDSWTSLGVIVALVLTLLTGWLPFDPIIAILVALNILWSGAQLMRRSVGGLMDEADPEVENKLRELLRQKTEKLDIRFHRLRHRNSGNKLFIDVHLLFPRSMPIDQAHEIATGIEFAIDEAFPVNAEVTTHLEPLEGHDEAHVKK